MNKLIVVLAFMLSPVVHANTIYDFTEMEEDDIQCLAENIYFESRNQGKLGKIAVALVTLNRVEHTRWPNNVCDVVKQAKKWGGIIIRHKCQFSWYCDGLSDKIRDMSAFIDARRAAIEGILWHEAGHDFVDGATHYHTTKVNPYWNAGLDYITTIDDHIFYK
jgi:spore germination cell wall hydrolase CwlJ-like protein|tara:strand:+ start:1452 stop:1940 length:489 start_codon:yes stop_codon:yes gene_type:complete